MTPEDTKQSLTGYKVLGFNLLVFAVYTLLFTFSNADGAFVAGFVAIIHFVVCTIVALATRSWMWFLAGLIILVIGFGTCVSNFHLDTR